MRTPRELDQVEHLLAALDEEVRRTGIHVELVARVLVGLHLARDQRPANRRAAAAHEARADVMAGHDDDAVPGEVAEVLDVAVLDDQDAGPLDAAIQRQSREERGRIGVAPEVDEPGIGAGPKIERLIHAVGAGAAVGERRHIGRRPAAGELHRAGLRRLQDRRAREAFHGVEVLLQDGRIQGGVGSDGVHSRRGTRASLVPASDRRQLAAGAAHGVLDVGLVGPADVGLGAGVRRNPVLGGATAEYPVRLDVAVR